MDQEIARLQFRIPKPLLDWLRKEAEHYSRSMNGQLVEILKKQEQEGRVQQ